MAVDFTAFLGESGCSLCHKGDPTELRRCRAVGSEHARVRLGSCSATWRILRVEMVPSDRSRACGCRPSLPPVGSLQDQPTWQRSSRKLRPGLHWCAASQRLLEPLWARSWVCSAWQEGDLTSRHFLEALAIPMGADPSRVPTSSLQVPLSWEAAVMAPAVGSLPSAGLGAWQQPQDGPAPAVAYTLGSEQGCGNPVSVSLRFLSKLILKTEEQE